jgi:hypothetical protein
VKQWNSETENSEAVKQWNSGTVQKQYEYCPLFFVSRFQFNRSTVSNCSTVQLILTVQLFNCSTASTDFNCSTASSIGVFNVF